MRYARAHLFKLINIINLFVTVSNAPPSHKKNHDDGIYAQTQVLPLSTKKKTIHAVFDKINSTIPHFTIIEKLNRYAWYIYSTRKPAYSFCWPLPSCAHTPFVSYTNKQLELYLNMHKLFKLLFIYKYVYSYSIIKTSNEYVNAVPCAFFLSLFSSAVLPLSLPII